MATRVETLPPHLDPVLLAPCDHPEIVPPLTQASAAAALLRYQAAVDICNGRLRTIAETVGAQPHVVDAR